MIVGITGGSGFIGQALVRRQLGTGNEVRVLTRQGARPSVLPPQVRLFQGDLTSGTGLVPFADGVDVLYHCAAEIKDESRMQAVHLDGTRALIEVARGRIGRWVQLSSTGAYGKRREGVVTEDTPLSPVNTYEKTKVGSDELVAEAGGSGAFPFVVLRPSNVFAGSMSNRSLFALLAMIERGWFFFMGPQGASANYIHVENVVDALCLCGSRSQAVGRVYNVSDHVSMEEFIGMMSRALGRASPPTARLPAGPVRALAKVFPFLPLTPSRIDVLTSRVVYPIDRIQRELGYRPSVTMEEGVRDLVAGWRQRGRS
jgi:nucleoside-diphosphate-sugar epimerase